MFFQQLAVAPEIRHMAHRDAYQLSRRALRSEAGNTVVLDLSHVEDMTTSAFARLILLRRQLRREGKDLRLKGLSGRAASVYEINRLSQVLPTI